MIQFEPFSMCRSLSKKNFLLISPFLLKLKKKILKSAILDKTSFGGAERRYSQKLTSIFCCQETSKNIKITFPVQSFFSCCFEPQKKQYIFNFNEISHKYEKIFCEIIYQLNCSTIANMNHMKHIYFRIYFLSSRSLVLGWLVGPMVVPPQTFVKK